MGKGHDKNWLEPRKIPLPLDLELHYTLIIIHCCCCLVAKSYPTLCDSMDCSPPCFSVHGISQVRILGWVAISFPKGSSSARDWTQCLLHWQVDSLPLSHQGSPMIPYKESSAQLSLFSPPYEDAVKKQLIASQEESPHQNPTIADTLISDSQPLHLWEKKLLLFKLSSLQYFVMTARRD